jgi:hypothetical protein
MVTTGNTNLAGTALAQPGAVISTSANGTGSDNTATVSDNRSQTTDQNNGAVVANSVSDSAVTGTNQASMNNGDATIQTGDANVSGTLMTAVNTNLAGVTVSEFNVVDNHTGDLILDFAANCISNCPTNPEAEISGNASNSSNVSELTVNSSDASFQNNDAAIENSLVLDANSGDNTASMNTDGNSVIMTGDANVSASSLTFANNNVEGNVVYGVVNIYGDLTGDIVFPEEALANCCQTPVDASIATNGAATENTTKIDQDTADTVIQNNDAVITNNLDLAATSGDNHTAYNTGGDSTVMTGNTSTNTQVVNIANNNLEGGTWWIVLVNEAGKWIGKILGSPDGSNVAASQGTQFTVADNGNVLIEGNGANSQNTTGVSQTSSQTVAQNNHIVLNNNLDLTANTGGNNASKNTGGNSEIMTGDATIIANVVNFVNNNIAHGGKVFITVVNVFGSWIGDFVTPGQEKNLAAATEKNPAVGGTMIETGQDPLMGEVFYENEVIATIIQENEDSQLATVQAAAYRTRRIQVISPTPPAFTQTDPAVLSSTRQGEEPAWNGFSATDGSVLAYVTSNPEALTKGNRVIKINLAWLLIILSCVILTAAIRRILERRSVLSRSVQIAAS